MESKGPGRQPKEVIRPAPALKSRISSLVELAKTWFGDVGYLWVLAYIVSGLPTSVHFLLSFAVPREIVNSIITDSQEEWQQGDQAANVAFLTRLSTVIGRKRWDKMRRSLKYDFDPLAEGRKKYTARMLELKMFTVKHIDDMLGRKEHDAARKRLIEQYSPVWTVEMGKPMERLWDPMNDDKGSDVGACVDLYGAAALAVKSVIEYDKFYKPCEMIVRHDRNGPYLYFVIGDGCDEYPRTRKNCATEGTIGVRNELGASCSPERQYPYFSADVKENSDQASEQAESLLILHPLFELPLAYYAPAPTNR